MNYAMGVFGCAQKARKAFLTEKWDFYCIFILGKLCLLRPPTLHGHAMNPATEAGNRQPKATSRSDDERIKLYVVSVTKFVLLYALTAGGYIFYWSYRNWASCKALTGSPIAPLLRAALWPFFILPLFDKVQNGLDKTGRSYFWQPQTRGLLIMLLVMLSVLVTTSVTRPSDLAFVFIANTALIASCCAMFVEAQRAINTLAGDPLGSHNNAFSCSNIVWMVMGVLYMTVITYVFFMLEG